MELTQEHRSLIESIVRKNSKFNGNEDLIEDFCSEVFKRSYSIVTSVEDINHLEAYLRKVATSAILDVLKNSGRIKKTRSGYTQIHETPLVPAIDDSNDKSIVIFDIPDPAPHFEEKIIKKDELVSIINVISKINKEDKNKRFNDLFMMRYVKNMKQNEIASELEISQGEVSKRLLELVKKIKFYLN